MENMEQQKTVGFLLRRVDCNDGVASHCETLIRGLKAVGWKVVLITGAVFYDAKSVRRFELFKELTEDWLVFEHMRPLVPNLADVARIREIVKKHKIAIFHAHGYSMLLLARILKIVTGLHCVATFHPSMHSDDPKMLTEAVLRPKIRQYQIYLKAFAPKAFIALSSDIEKFLIQDLGFRKTKVRKILAGVDTKYFCPPSPQERHRVREQLGICEEDLVCSLVGRLNWNKGHDILIEAVRKARKALSGVTLKCLFAGSGDQEQQIKEYALVSDEDLRCFIFLGFADELREVYWASDIFALPSRSEGFALVVAEAMCCGTVPIRTPGGGAKDQIQEGITGYTIPFDDVEALSQAIQSLADRNFRMQIGKQCIEYAVSAFDQEPMVERTVELYSEYSTVKQV
jgi:glycosyltransferase involved in cell wall biosynthesis